MVNKDIYEKYGFNCISQKEAELRIVIPSMEIWPKEECFMPKGVTLEEAKRSAFKAMS